MLSAEIIASLEILINLAFKEDFGDDFIKKKIKQNSGDGDITTAALENFDTGTLHKQNCLANMIAKEDLIFCGRKIMEHYIKRYTQLDCQFAKMIKDSKMVKAGDNLFSIFGKAKEILKHERIILNLLQYLCGISTKVDRYKKILLKTNIRLLDTRKTLPGYRALAKYAVQVGGGQNHRQGLFDHYLIKDNHIALMQDDIMKTVTAVIRDKSKRVKKNIDWQKKKIIVECATICQIQNILPYLTKIDRVLLDNMNLENMKSSIDLLRVAEKKQKTKIEIEASGSIDEAKIRKIKNLNLDYISVGALTHSIIAKDVSLDICYENK